MKTRESSIEKKVCDYARSKGMLVYKFTSPGKRAVPDRLLISKRGSVFFLEFKALAEKPTILQAREHDILRDYGQRVWVIDNVTDGKMRVDMVVADDLQRNTL